MTQMVNVLHGKVVVVWMKRGGGLKYLWCPILNKLL